MKNRRPLDESAARDIALRALARREHSAAELKSKLTRRGHDEQTAVGIVERLAGYGLQSDGRYAEMLARNRMQQGYGPLRIEAELAAAGIDDAEAAAAIAELECDWSERARQVCRRKFKSAPADAADWQRQYRFLAARGFESEQIRAALKGGVDEPE